MTIVTRFYDKQLSEDVVFRNVWTPNFRSRLLPSGKTVVTTNAAGGWLLISNDEHRALQSISIPESLFEAVEEAQIVLTKRNARAFADAYELWSSPHIRHPTHHIIITTLRCNLSCGYCHAQVVPANAGTKYDLTPDTGRAIVAFALNSEAPAQHFEFQGGESLLASTTLKFLVEHIRAQYADTSKGVSISVQTNGTLLSQEWMRFFEQHGVSVGTSLDGPGQANNASRRLNSGREAYSHIKSQADRFGIPTLPTINRANINNWRQLLDTHIASNRSDTAVLNPVYPINFAAKNWATVGIEWDDFLTMYSDACDYLRTKWSPEHYPLERRLRLALAKLLRGRDTDFSDFGAPCGMVHSQIAYHTNGDIYTCDEGRDFVEFRIGNVKEDTYDEVVFGAKTRALKSLSIPNDAECQTCAYRPFCSACPAYDHAKTGLLSGTSAGGDKCKQTKLIYDRIFSWIEEDPQAVSEAAASHGIIDA